VKSLAAKVRQQRSQQESPSIKSGIRSGDDYKSLTSITLRLKFNC
jgi:hypothetical protein